MMIHHSGCHQFFRNQAFLSLQRCVRVIYPWETDPIAQRCIMKLTGVPPHVVELASSRELKMNAGTIATSIIKWL
jgi:hypothetical protein